MNYWGYIMQDKYFVELLTAQAKLNADIKKHTKDLDVCIIERKTSPFNFTLKAILEKIELYKILIDTLYRLDKQDKQNKQKKEGKNNNEQ